MTQLFHVPAQSFARDREDPILPVHIWGATDRGKRRENNEDAIYPDVSPIFFDPSPHTLVEKGRMLVVADGMGGVRAGAEASRWAVRVAVERYYDNPSPDIRSNLKAAVEGANASLYQYLSDTNALGAGCTMAAAVIHQDMLYVVNVGDSRIYLIRGRDMGQITRDHSVVQQKLDQGLIVLEDVKYDPSRNLIYRSLGTNPDIPVDAFPPIQLMKGDCVLLCSDGLSDMLTNDEILEIAKHRPHRVVKHLITAANKRGGNDNITTLFAYVGTPILRDTRIRPSIHATNPLSVERKRVLMQKQRTAAFLRGIRIIIIIMCILALLYWGLGQSGVLDRIIRTIFSGGL